MGQSAAMRRAAGSAVDAVAPPSAASRDFIMSTEPEPHSVRRAEILKKYPQIKELFGHEWRTKYIVALTVALQLFISWLTLEWQWIPYLMVVYMVGATANHSLFLAVHELAHNLGAKSITGNKIIGLIANIPVAIPYSITFKPYHMEHHRYQGQDHADTDVPTWLEGYLITRSTFGRVDHACRKAIFMFLQIFAYAFRPMIIKPNLVPLDGWIALNWLVVFGMDGLIVLCFGSNALLYLLLSTFFAGSIHPTAGHFIAEHYVMEGETETYSYYGPLNMLTYNVGYHNEHHDFPSIAWSSLPKVRQIAPEYYDNLPQCESWPGTLLRYIFDDSISPFSRVKRATKKVQ